jgi:hypothetical protein
MVFFARSSLSKTKDMGFKYFCKQFVDILFVVQRILQIRRTSCFVWETRAGIFKQSMGARNRVGIRLLYRPARLHRLAEFIPWNRLPGSINVLKYGLSIQTPFRFLYNNLPLKLSGIAEFTNFFLHILNSLIFIEPAE